ncbi:MAG: flavin monoamine oxidase family protein [Acidimicrobiia bacterium]
MNDVSRRSFLAGSLAVGAGAVLTRRSVPILTRPRADAGTASRAIVVGAGLAGLTAALDLRAAGWNVVVLEARRRVGGRVRTVYAPFSEGLHAESGGESIDDNHDRIQALVARFGLQTERRLENRDATATVRYRGRTTPAAKFLAGDRAVLEDYNRFYTESDKLAAGIDPEHPERARNAERLDRRSLADFIAGLHLDPRARFLVETAETGEYASDPGDVSLLFYAQQAAIANDVSDAASETMRISGGNSRLTQAMAAELGSAVVLGAPVRSIRQTRDLVIASAGGHSYTGAQLVLAVPPPTLRAIAFTPELSRSVAAMVRGLQLGPATKVMTEYDDRFWRAGGGSGLVVTDLPFRVAWDASDSYPSDSGILTAFTTGSHGESFARMSDARRIRGTRRQVAQVFPAAHGREVHSATIAWPNERSTGGGYVVFRPGQMTKFWEVLRRPAGRIRFAGEHTESLAGYMESAVRSGHRVAAAIGVPRAVKAGAVPAAAR